MDPNGHEANNQEITGMLHVVLDKARHFAGTPFDCEITLFHNARGSLTKRIHRATDGTFHNDSSRCRMARGSAQRLPVFGTHGLFELLAEELPDDCAIATGQLRPDLPDRVQIAAKKLLDRAPGAIARSGENIIYTARAGFILLDFDTKGMPPAIKQKIEALGGFPNAIESVCPAFGKAGSILRRSTSSGIYNTATGEHRPDSGGLHVYVWVRDVSDAKRFLYCLHDRLWLVDFGWMLPGRAGQGLNRSIIDKSVYSPERLVFEGGPELDAPGFAQEPRLPLVHDGGLLDTRAACPDLTKKEQKELERLIAAEKERIAPECRAARAAFIGEQIEKAVDRGAAREAAQRMAEVWTHGVLTASAVLYFDDLGAVTVADILADPARYEDETLADPIEQFENGYGPDCAIVKLKADGTPWIFSWAHGSCEYALKQHYIPIIELQPGEIECIVDQAESALIAAGRGLYQRDGLIVGVGEVKVITTNEKEILAQRIEERGEHALVEDLSAAAEFQRWNEREKKFVKTSCPKDIAKTLQDRRLRLRLPILMGVINAPTLRPDGSILDRPGYDERTGLLFDPRGAKFPAIPPRPCYEDAKDALETLFEPIAQFPFISDVDKAVALSGILTVCVRRSLRAAPLHGYTAPMPGTGKSHLVDIASILATGQEAGVTAQGNTEEEFEKRLASALLEGAAIIAIDNCERPVGGAFLNQVCTQRIVKPRILGLSKTPAVTANAFVTANGNNLVFYGDTTRRALLCRLDAGVERPELREFDFDPIDTAKRYRPQYVAAALTILRAFFLAGRPQQGTPLGSYTEWSRAVRDALIWLGCDDPVASMEIIRNKDPARNALLAVVTQWLKAFGTDVITVAKLIEKAEGKPETKDRLGSVIELGMPADPELKQALVEVAGLGGKISGKRVAGWLGRNQDRIVGGHLIVQWQDAASSGRSYWRLQKAGRPAEAIEPEPEWNGDVLDGEGFSFFTVSTVSTVLE